MREVCFLLDRGGEVLWRENSESPLALPDSRSRWEAIWQHRQHLAAVVHSHPLGPHAFSEEDLSTMAALDDALGRPLRYGVLSPSGLLWQGEALDGHAWVEALARASGMWPLQPAPYSADT